MNLTEWVRVYSSGTKAEGSEFEARRTGDAHKFLRVILFTAIRRRPTYPMLKLKAFNALRTAQLVAFWTI